MNKDPESWARVSPDAVTAGSAAQSANVLKMALADIGALADELQDTRRKLIAANDRLIAINHALLNGSATDRQILADARKAAFPSTERHRHG